MDRDTNDPSGNTAPGETQLPTQKALDPEAMKALMGKLSAIMLMVRTEFPAYMLRHALKQGEERIEVLENIGGLLDDKVVVEIQELQATRKALKAFLVFQQEMEEAAEDIRKLRVQQAARLAAVQMLGLK